MKTFRRSSFHLAPHSLFVVLISLSPLLLVSSSVVLAQWEPDVRLTYNDSLSQTANNNGWSIAAGPGNLVHVVWQDKQDGRWQIFYRRSTDAGLTWAPSLRLTPPPGFAWQPSLCILDSIVHVVWSNYLTSEPYEIYYKRSTDGGATWDTTNLRLTFNIYGSFEPSIAASDTIVHVVWRDARDNGNDEIYYKRSSNRGASWDTLDTRLTYATSASWLPSVAAIDSFVHSVWWDYRTGRWEVFYKRSSNFGTIWGSDTCLTDDQYNSCYPSAATSGSIVHVAWSDFRTGAPQVYYKRSMDNGISWSPDIRLTNTPNGAGNSSIAASGSMVHLVWQDSRDGMTGEIYYKRSSDDGLSWSSDVRLTNNSDTSKCPSVAVLGPIVHVVWYDHRDGNDEIYYKRNATGSGIELPFTQQTIKSPILFSFHPNPFTSYTTLPGHSSDRFALYDISGRKEGVYRGDRIGEGLSAGVYFLRPEGRDAKPLRVVKVR